MTSGDTTLIRAREFEFSDDDFRSLCTIVHGTTGITLSESKREMVYGRLARRLRALGLVRFRDYRALLATPGSDELGHLTNAITTNLTSFFREPHHFDVLREQVLVPGKRLRLWSAACSTGEEPCSIAMTVAETLPDWQQQDIRILATDLDTDVLSRAQTARYGAERLSTLTAERQRRWFNHDDSSVRPIYQFHRDLAALITYRPLNLMRPLPMGGPIDAIFLRNVIIYFDKQTQRDLFARLAPLQKPGALLFLGHSESLFNVSSDYEPIGRTVYRRLGA